MKKITFLLLVSIFWNLCGVQRAVFSQEKKEVFYSAFTEKEYREIRRTIIEVQPYNILTQLFTDMADAYVWKRSYVFYVSTYEFFEDTKNWLPVSGYRSEKLNSMVKKFIRSPYSLERQKAIEDFIAQISQEVAPITMELVEKIGKELHRMESRSVVQRVFYDTAVSSYLLKDFPEYKEHYKEIHEIEKQIYFETHPRFEEFPASIQKEFYDTLQIDSTLAAYEAMRVLVMIFGRNIPALKNREGEWDELENNLNSISKAIHKYHTIIREISRHPMYISPEEAKELDWRYYGYTLRKDEIPKIHAQMQDIFSKLTPEYRHIFFETWNEVRIDRLQAIFPYIHSSDIREQVLSHKIAKNPKYKTPIPLSVQHPPLPKILQQEHFFEILDRYIETYYGGKYDFLVQNIDWIQKYYPKIAREVKDLENTWDHVLFPEYEQLEELQQKITILKHQKIAAPKDEISALQQQYDDRYDMWYTDKKTWFQDIENVTQKIIFAEKENEFKRFTNITDSMPEYVRHFIDSDGVYYETPDEYYSKYYWERARDLAWEFMPEYW